MDAAETLDGAVRPVAERVALSQGTRTGLAIGGTAAGLGILGDALLRSVPWGINLTLWALALVAAVAALQRWARTEDADAGWMPLAVLAAAMMAWRDSPTLKALDLAALLAVLGLAMVRARGGEVKTAGLAHLALGLLASAGDAAAGTVRVLTGDVRWGELRGGGRMHAALSALRGGALALPLLLLFGGLLSSADARFERLMSQVFHFDPAAVTGHVLLSLAVAWVAGGVLRTMTMGEGVPGPELARPKGLSLGMVEVGTVLGLLNALFLAFVIVQLPYFFGSAARVRGGGTTSFSDYAVRGFFELVTVAGMVLPLLLFADWIARRERPWHGRAFRVLAGIQVALLFVMMASALHRMRLYWSAYGLTEQRLYTTAFMLWLGGVFAWFAWTVLRGNRPRFAWGALLMALDVTVLLHVANPDGLIVRVNASRPDAATRFDARYAASLSADGVPALVAALGRMEGDARCVAAERLLARWDGDGADWRSWSLARARARGGVQRERMALMKMSCTPPDGSAASALPSAARSSGAGGSTESEARGTGGSAASAPVGGSAPQVGASRPVAGLGAPSVLQATSPSDAARGAAPASASTETTEAASARTGGSAPRVNP